MVLWNKTQGCAGQWSFIVILLCHVMLYFVIVIFDWGHAGHQWPTEGVYSPGAFNRKAFHFQQLPKWIILTMDNVLPLLVIQFLHNDVLTKIVHYLKLESSELCKKIPVQLFNVPDDWLNNFRIINQSVPSTYSGADKASIITVYRNIISRYKIPSRNTKTLTYNISLLMMHCVTPSTLQQQAFKLRVVLLTTWPKVYGHLRITRGICGPSAKLELHTFVWNVFI